MLTDYEKRQQAMQQALSAYDQRDPLPVQEAINYLAETIHATAQEKGWYDKGERNDYEMIALVHAELSEAVEALRIGNPNSEKLPQFSLAEEEFADAIIRLLDQAYKNKWNLGGAIIAKMAYNKNRPYRHGGKLA